MMRRRMVISPWYSSCSQQRAEPDITGVLEIALGCEVGDARSQHSVCLHEINGRSRQALTDQLWL